MLGLKYIDLITFFQIYKNIPINKSSFIYVYRYRYVQLIHLELKGVQRET